MIGVDWGTSWGWIEEVDGRKLGDWMEEIFLVFWVIVLDPSQWKGERGGDRELERVSFN